MRMGVIGGTFDPIHLGHLIIAEQARTLLALGRVLFVPAGQPPHKLDKASQIADAEHRLAMVRLAIADNEHFVVSRVDLDRTGPCYTVDTIRLLQEAWKPDAEVFFLIGGDSLRDLPTWHQPQRLLRLCHVVAVRRPGHDADLHALEQSLPGAADLIEVIDSPLIDISSTDIRKRAGQGQRGSIRYLVPAPVERYIREHGLYRIAPPESEHHDAARGASTPRAARSSEGEETGRG